LISLVSVPIFTLIADKAGIVDIPDKRKIHTGHIPRLGGLGIVASVFITFFIIGEFSERTLWYITANLVIILTGLIDDIKVVSPKIKFSGQIIATLIMIFFAGILYPINSFSPELSYWISVLITFFWIIGVTNAVNLMDGMDGLAGGIAFMTFGAMAVSTITNGNEYYALICIAFMGGILGFLRYNIPPAKVFMGDTGSLFLGFNISVIAIIVSLKSATILSVFIPFLYISLPVFDTFLAISRRIKRKQSPFTPDKEHIHHRLLGLEFSTAQSLIIFYSISITLSIVAISSLNNHINAAIIGTFIILYLILVLLKLMHIFNFRDKIRQFNIWLRSTASKLTAEYNKKDNLITFLDSIIAILTLSLFVYFIVKFQNWNFANVLILLLYLISLIFISLMRKKLEIHNDFLSFLIFWAYFFIVSQLIMNHHHAVLHIVTTILFSIITFKIIILKRFNLFLSNPMEFIIIFCLFLIYKISTIELYSFIEISVMSFLIYYANKVYFSKNYQYFRTYLAISIILILFAPINFYQKLYLDFITKEPEYAYSNSIAYPPLLKKTIKKLIENNELEKARNIFLSSQKYKPIYPLEKLYLKEVSILYSKMMLNEVLNGDLIKSNQLLKEYLTYYPDMVQQVSEILELILKNIDEMDVSGIEKINIHDNNLTKILLTYQTTLENFSDNYYAKGFIQRSKKFDNLAHILQKNKN
jgi:UDP-GlcNAc:undecaprenyl-phosphate GlcNAc-1-phosphate transferase